MKCKKVMYKYIEKIDKYYWKEIIIFLLLLIATEIFLIEKLKIGETGATLIGGALGFFVSMVTISVTIKDSSKNTFINTITIARKEYIATLRKVVSEFCASAESKDNNNTRLIELSYHLRMVLWATIGIVLTILSLFSAFFFMDRFQRWEKGNK